MIPPSNSSLVHFAETTFHIADYVIFAVFLAVSGGVGIFFSFRSQKTTDEALFGGRQMRAIPVGISTGVSFLSASSIVGLPAEMYVNGYSYAVGTAAGSVGYLLGCMLIAYLLHPLGMTSLNEYLNRRFQSRFLTYAANLMVLVCIFQYMGSCMFGSVVAFSSATGGRIGIVLALIIGGAVGIFYTALGGLKAVVWSDVLQSGVMAVGVLSVVFKSIADTPGGMTEISRLNWEYGRLHALDPSADLTIRHTLWGMLIGISLNWSSWSVQPAGVQRLCCTRTVKDAYIVSGIAAGLFLFFSLLPCWAGINIFGYYISRGCDIYAAGWVKNNEIILYYVRERLGYPGFQGLFIAALYAGSLSSLSSGLNAASAILWNDSIKPLLRTEVSEARAVIITKVIVVVFGILAMFWCYCLISFGGLIAQVNATITSSMYGAYFSLFLFAIFFVHANYKAAIIGLVVSFVFTLWLGIGDLLQTPTARMTLPSTIVNCEVRNSSSVRPIVSLADAANATSSTQECSNKSMVDTLFSLSYVWFSLVCTIIYLVVSLMFTGCLGPSSKEPVDSRLLFPLVRGNGCRRRKFRGPDRDSAAKENGKDLEKLNCEIEVELNTKL